MADRKERVILDLDNNPYRRGLAGAAVATSLFVKQLDDADSRLSNIVQTALAIAPAFVPIAATATPALAGLTSQAGFAAAGLGVVVAAVNGVGDAVGALREYELEPTEDNLAAVREEMDKLPASARDFARYINGDVMPVLRQLREASSDGALPGFEDGIDELLTRLPGLVKLVDSLASASGQLAREAGEGLAGEEFNELFRFLKAEAEPTLLTFGRTVGNVLDGLATTLIGLNPLANDFEDALYDWSVGFSQIEPEDFEQFVSYVRDVGPDAVDAVTAIGGALVAVVQAAAPVGSVALPVIESVANVLETVADSPAGPVLIATAAGLSAVSRSIALFRAANGSALLATIQGVSKSAPAATSGLARMNQSISALKTGAPVLAGLALAYSDVDDAAGLSNTTMLATMGLMAGGWGAAVGAAVGLTLDLAASNDTLTDSLERVDDMLEDAFQDAPGTANLEQLDQSIEDARQKYIDLVEDVEDGGLPALKFRAESLFGENDVEEAYAEFTRLQEERAELGRRELESREQYVADTSYLRAIEVETNVLLENIAAMRAKRAEALRGLNAELDYKSAVLDAKDALKENGRTVNENTRAGQANLRALYVLASAWNEQDEATKNAAGSLRTARRNFVDTAVAMGMGEEKARDLARELFELPTEVPIKIGVDHETAMAHAKAVKAQLDSIDRFIPVNIHVSRTGQGGDLPYLSGGQRVQQKAFGDFKDRHNPEIARGGAWRVWAEPETQGESYIPHANDSRRPRAKQILERTATMFGGEVSWYATGGVVEDERRRRRAGLESVGQVDTSGPFNQQQYAITAALLAAARDQANAARNQLEAAEVAEVAARDQKDAAERQLENTRQQREQFAGQVRNQFERNPFGSGFNAAIRSLNRDTTGAEGFESLLRQLEALGLDGDAYGALAASGDTATARGMLARGTAGVELFESSYTGRDQALDSLSTYAADSQFADLIAAQTAEAAAANAVWEQTNLRVGELSGSVWALGENVTALQNQLGSFEDAVRNMSQRPINVSGARGPIETAREIARHERAGA